MGTLGRSYQEESKDCLLGIYGGKSFVKIYQAFGIGKVKFSFANKEAAAEGIDVFVDLDIMNCDLIDQIKSGELRKLAAHERKRAQEANEQFCKPVWESPAGICTDGNTVRKFEIQPGFKTEYVFRATEGKKNIMVGCDNRFLKVLAERWKFLQPDYEAYMRNIFNIANMKNEYYSNKESAPSSMVVDDDELPVKVPPQEKKQTAQNTQQTNQAATSTQKENTGFVGIPSASQTEKGNSSSEVQTTNASTDSSKEQNNTAEQGNTVDQEVKIWKMKISAGITDMSSGCKALKAVTEDNKEFPLVLNKKILSTPAFKDFEARAKRVGTMIKIKGYLATDRIMVTEIL